MGDYITGGTIYVSGATNDGDSALDYDGSASITGGTILAAGTTGMARSLTAAGSQGVMLVSTGSQAADSTVELTNSSGETLVSWQPNKAYTCVVISAPGITSGETYTLTAGSASTEIAMTSLSYSDVAGGMMGGMGGQMDGQMPGQMNGGQMGGGPGGMGGQPGRR